MKGVHFQLYPVHIGSQIVDHQKLIQSYEQLILLADQLNKKNHTITNLDLVVVWSYGSF